jgi:hypothetical protein
MLRLHQTSLFSLLTVIDVRPGTSLRAREEEKEEPRLYRNSVSIYQIAGEDVKLTSDATGLPSCAVAHFSNTVDAIVVTTASIVSTVVEGMRMDAVIVAIAATRVDVATVVTVVMEKKEDVAIAATDMDWNLWGSSRVTGQRTVV